MGPLWVHPPSIDSSNSLLGCSLFGRVIFARHPWLHCPRECPSPWGHPPSLDSLGASSLGAYSLDTVSLCVLLRHGILTHCPHTAYLRYFLARATFLVTLYLGGLLGQTSLGMASIGMSSMGGAFLRVLIGYTIIVGILFGRNHLRDSTAWPP